MIKGTTKSGFNYTIQEGALDDYELLEELREIDKGNTSLIVDVIEKIIGSEQKEQLKKHVRDETGRVSIKRMVDEIGEILRGNQTVQGFEKDAAEYEITFTVRGALEDRKTFLDEMQDAFETDVLLERPGRIYFGDYYIDGFVTSSETKTSDIAVYYSQNKVKLYCPRPIWTKENPYTFYSYGASSSDNKRYPGRYPFRYANGMNNTHVQNPHFTDANFTLVIYGPVVNPQVIIGDKSYLVNIVLEQGERLEIDSRTRTVTKISKNGEQVNAFHNREKGKKFFKKIPPGRQKVVWSGKFDWDLVIYEERSEPRWSGWKQR